MQRVLCVGEGETAVAAKTDFSESNSSSRPHRGQNISGMAYHNPFVAIRKVAPRRLHIFVLVRVIRGSLFVLVSKRTTNIELPCLST